MKKLLLLSGIGCLLSISLMAQSQYFEFIAWADSLLEEEQYEAAALYFDKAFKEKEGTKWAYYDAACAWAKTEKNKSKAIAYLQKSVNKRMFDWKKMEADENLKNLSKERAWQKLRADLLAKKTKFEEGLNIPVKNQLEALHTRDQTLRKLYRVAVKELGEDSLGIRYYESLMRQEDSICLKEVVTLIDQYGWLGINEVGEQGNQTIWLVIQHAPLEVQEKYYPLMEASVAKGESSGADFAYLVDRIFMRKGEKQIYGSQYRFDRTTRKRFFHPIKDYKNVNARREAVGLMPIETYAKLIHLKYDPSSWDVE